MKDRSQGKILKFVLLGFIIVLLFMFLFYLQKQIDYKNPSGRDDPGGTGGWKVELDKTA